jgi:hypothetical protein
LLLKKAPGFASCWERQFERWLAKLLYNKELIGFVAAIRVGEVKLSFGEV